MGGKRLTTESFIEKSKSIHGDRYDYSKTVFIKSKTRVIITCSKHGDFYQIPHEHLKGSNCKRCSATKWNEARFIEESSKKHKNFYSYENSQFTLRSNNVFITCPLHGRFEASAHAHLKGVGCRECWKKTWTGQSKEHYVNYCNEKTQGLSYLYLFKINTQKDNVYKIGISCRGVVNRYFNESGVIGDVILEVRMEASIAWDIERAILQEFSEFISGDSYLRKGNMECFKNPKLDEICYSINNMINNRVI